MCPYGGQCWDINNFRWWWTGGLECCDSWGRRAGHDWETELNWTEPSLRALGFRNSSCHSPLHFLSFVPLFSFVGSYHLSSGPEMRWARGLHFSPLFIQKEVECLRKESSKQLAAHLLPPGGMLWPLHSTWVSFLDCTMSHKTWAALD